LFQLLTRTPLAHRGTFIPDPFYLLRWRSNKECCFTYLDVLARLAVAWKWIQLLYWCLVLSPEER